MMAPTRRLALIVSLLAASIACAGRARTERPERPAPATGDAGATAAESLATAFFAAIADERWTDAVRYLDLRGFEAFRRSVADRPIATDSARGPTVEDLMASDPRMPRAVAEYQARRLAELMREHTFSPLSDFAEVPTVDSLMRLSLADAAARWLRAQDVRWQMQRIDATDARAVDARRCEIPPGDSAMRAALDSAQNEAVRTAWRHVVIGTARRDSVAWVLYPNVLEVVSMADTAPASASSSEDRALAEWDGRMLSPLALELRRREDGWRIIPGPRFLSTGAIVASTGPECHPIAETPPGA